MPQATVAIASPPQRPRSSSPQSSSSTFGTDEPLRLNIGDGPGESGDRGARRCPSGARLNLFCPFLRASSNVHSHSFITSASVPFDLKLTNYAAPPGAGYTAVDPESRRIIPTDAERSGKTVVKMVYVVLEAQYQVRNSCCWQQHAQADATHLSRHGVPRLRRSVPATAMCTTPVADSLLC